MDSKHASFDCSRLLLLPLDERKSDLDLSTILPLKPRHDIHATFRTVASRIASARANSGSRIFMMGAHVIRAGVQRYIIDLIEKGFLNCITMNGAGVIHDFEFALVGQTTESVSRYISDGRFGFWLETGRINDIVSNGAKRNLGLGEAVGAAIHEEKFPYKNISILAAAYRCGVPVTVHVGIGCDIIHQHPNFDGSAFGATSYTDFLIFAKVLELLEKGVVMNFGSAVTAPEVFLKALAMVRNVARQEGRAISDFTTLVCDLAPVPENYQSEASPENHEYYFRPWKTMLVRTVADGGESYYYRGRHSESVPQLWTALTTRRLQTDLSK